MKQKQEKKDIYLEKKENKLLTNQYINITIEYQNITHLLDNASNHLSKFKTKNWTEINDQSR